MSIIEGYDELKKLEYKKTNNNWLYIFLDCHSTNKAKDDPENYKLDKELSKTGNFPSEHDFYKKLLEYYDSGFDRTEKEDPDIFDHLEESIIKFEIKFKIEEEIKRENRQCLIASIFGATIVITFGCLNFMFPH